MRLKFLNNSLEKGKKKWSGQRSVFVRSERPIHNKDHSVYVGQRRKIIFNTYL